MIALSPSSKTAFEKVLWLGPAPSNKARKALLADLLKFLNLEQSIEYRELGESYATPPSQKTLFLGNFEDFIASSNWPESDSKQSFLGLFVKDVPASTSLLTFYQKKALSFIVGEQSQLVDLHEALDDLLRS